MGNRRPIANLKLGPATKPIRATIKLQNNCLRARRMALGLSSREIAEKVGISYQSYLRMENMYASPISVKEGQPWLNAAKKLAKFYQVLPENLFPSVVLAVDQPVTSREFDESEIQALLPDYMRRESLGPEEIISQNQLRGSVTAALKMLNPMEVEVVKRHYGLDTGTGRNLSQVGKEVKRSVTRISQIHDIAIRKLGKVVSHETILPVFAPDELGWGTRCIRHNLRGIYKESDPTFPLLMKVLLSMPDPSLGGPSFESLQFQGKTEWTMMKAVDSCSLATNPRLLTIDISDRDGKVLRHKEGPKGSWTVPPKVQVVPPVSEEPLCSISADCPSLNIRLDGIEITPRLFNSLNSHGICYLGELASMEAEQVFSIYNFGSRMADEARNLLKTHDLRFGLKIPDWSPMSILIVVESDWAERVRFETSHETISFHEVIQLASGTNEPIANLSRFEISYCRLGQNSPEGQLRYDPPDRMGETESVHLTRLMRFKVSRRKAEIAG